jgi:hypothetical protein
VGRRRDRYAGTSVAARLPAAGVVLVDDGLATGLTMAAALAFVRRHGGQDVTVAVPCASAEAAEQFRRDADRFVSPVVQADFRAIADYYADFSPVEDGLVLELLARLGNCGRRPERERAGPADWSVFGVSRLTRRWPERGDPDAGGTTDPGEFGARSGAFPAFGREDSLRAPGSTKQDAMRGTPQPGEFGARSGAFPAFGREDSLRAPGSTKQDAKRSAPHPRTRRAS